MLRDIDYATAVARVRFHENNLLSSQDLEQLLTSKTPEEAASLLADRGYSQPDGPSDWAAMLSGRLSSAWELIREISPDFSVFHFLLVKNDFHNLKTVLKGTVTGAEYRAWCLSPSVVSMEVMAQAFSQNHYTALPDYMQKPADVAYEAFAHSGDGQLSDIRLDRGSLEATLLLSRATGAPLLLKLGEAMVSVADIRMAIRAAKSGKSQLLLEEAVCPSSSIYPKDLIAAAMAGLPALEEYLRRTPYESCADALKESVSSAEKWCDNFVTKQVDSAKYQSFGPGPLAAYLIRTEAEVKAVRTILAGKTAGLSDTAIRNRLREIA